MYTYFDYYQFLKAYTQTEIGKYQLVALWTHEIFFKQEIKNEKNKKQGQHIS